MADAAATAEREASAPASSSFLSTPQASAILHGKAIEEPWSRYREVDAPSPEPSAAEPLPRASPLCPRLTWASLHAVGLLLLWLSGAWPGWRLWPGGCRGFDALVALTVLLFLAAGLVDPGFVPTEEEQAEQAAGGSALAASLLALPPCPHCRSRQPARAKHCHACGRCVRRLDHHCWWLGNCVGEGNHRLFLAYLLAQAALLGVAGVAAAGSWIGGEAAARRAPHPAVARGAAAALFVLCLLLGALATTLFAFQLSLVFRGETTWEHLRRSRLNAAQGLPPKVRPYDRGALNNALSFCCGCDVGPPLVRVAPGVCPPIAHAVAVDADGLDAPAYVAPKPTLGPGPPFGL